MSNWSHSRSPNRVSGNTHNYRDVRDDDSFTYSESKSSDICLSEFDETSSSDSEYDRVRDGKMRSRSTKNYYNKNLMHNSRPSKLSNSTRSVSSDESSHVRPARADVAPTALSTSRESDDESSEDYEDTYDYAQTKRNTTEITRAYSNPFVEMYQDLFHCLADPNATEYLLKANSNRRGKTKTKKVNKGKQRREEASREKRRQNHYKAEKRTKGSSRRSTRDSISGSSGSNTEDKSRRDETDIASFHSSSTNTSRKIHFLESSGSRSNESRKTVVRMEGKKKVLLSQQTRYRGLSDDFTRGSNSSASAHVPLRQQPDEYSSHASGSVYQQEALSSVAPSNTQANDWYSNIRDDYVSRNSNRMDNNHGNTNNGMGQERGSHYSNYATPSQNNYYHPSANRLATASYYPPSEPYTVGIVSSSPVSSLATYGSKTSYEMFSPNNGMMGSNKFRPKRYVGTQPGLRREV